MTERDGHYRRSMDALEAFLIGMLIREARASVALDRDERAHTFVLDEEGDR